MELHRPVFFTKNCMERLSCTSLWGCKWYELKVCEALYVYAVSVSTHMPITEKKKTTKSCYADWTLLLETEGIWERVSPHSKRRFNKKYFIYTETCSLEYCAHTVRPSKTGVHSEIQCNNQDVQYFSPLSKYQYISFIYCTMAVLLVYRHW